MARRKNTASPVTDKALIIGDPHITPKSLEIAEELFSIIEDRPEKLVIFLGDILDTKEVIRGKCLNFLYEKLSSSKKRFVMLVGNHDYFNLECKDHSLKVFKKLENVEVVDGLYKFPENPALYAIPYIHDQEDIKKTFKKIPKDSILLAHLDVKGFDYGNGFICEEGITTRSLSKFKKVISGHFHKYQEKGKLVYLGTPFSHSFGESGQEKYIAAMDLETGDLDLLRTPFPRHVTIEVDCDDLAARPEGSFTGLDELIRCQYSPQDKVRVILKGIRENINGLKETGAIPEDVKIIERASKQDSKNINISEEKDNVSKFIEWSEKIKKLDEDTTKMGVHILEAVRDN